MSIPEWPSARPIRRALNAPARLSFRIFFLSRPIPAISAPLNPILLAGANPNDLQLILAALPKPSRRGRVVLADASSGL